MDAKYDNIKTAPTIISHTKNMNTDLVTILNK